jgi:hypothetical protein
MHFRIPKMDNRARWTAILYGLVIFIWLGFEDSSALPVALLGTGLAGLVVLLSLIGRLGGRMIPARLFTPGLILTGGIVGTGASLSAAMLMFFKNARHAHVFPDYPWPMIAAMLERAPAWALAGMLVGLALALLWQASKAESSS